jgi:dihydrolipoamide dehydrogenase
MRRAPLSIVFTDPQIAVVGTAFRDLDRDAIEIGAASYDDQGRARVIGKNAGLVRIYAERTHGAIVGAEMCGPRVENTAHLLAWAVQSRMRVEDALQMPFYHPVLEEGIRTALRHLSAALKTRGRLRPEDLECGPGV